MSNTKSQSYFICSTPRTGSTFLCSLLKSTKVAGHPESYFRIQDRHKWATKFNISKDHNFKEFLDACLRAGKTNNGIFASRIMWGTMDELIVDIKSEFIHLSGSDKELLTEVFGDIKFVYLKREDYAAQAVSRLRAEQTGVWQVTNSTQPQKDCLQYSSSEISKFISEAKKHDKEWASWFLSNGVEPYEVIYEDLIKNTNDTVKEIVEFLGLPLKPDVQLTTDNKKMSDDLSKEWINRYNDEMA